VYAVLRLSADQSVRRVRGAQFVIRIDTYLY